MLILTPFEQMLAKDVNGLKTIFGVRISIRDLFAGDSDLFDHAGIFGELIARHDA
jgi:hypothetical protein